MSALLYATIFTATLQAHAQAFNENCDDLVSPPIGGDTLSNISNKILRDLNFSPAPSLVRSTVARSFTDELLNLLLSIKGTARLRAIHVLGDLKIEPVRYQGPEVYEPEEMGHWDWIARKIVLDARLRGQLFSLAVLIHQIDRMAWTFSPPKLDWLRGIFASSSFERRELRAYKSECEFLQNVLRNVEHSDNFAEILLEEYKIPPEQRELFKNYLVRSSYQGGKFLPSQRFEEWLAEVTVKDPQLVESWTRTLETPAAKMAKKQWLIYFVFPSQYNCNAYAKMRLEMARPKLAKNH